MQISNETIRWSDMPGKGPRFWMRFGLVVTSRSNMLLDIGLVMKVTNCDNELFNKKSKNFWCWLLVLYREYRPKFGHCTVISKTMSPILFHVCFNPNTTRSH